MLVQAERCALRDTKGKIQTKGIKDGARIRGERLGKLMLILDTVGVFSE